MTKIYPVIMSGGAGTRLWPLSRQAQPKQYHALVSDKTLLQETVARAEHAPEDLNIAAPSFVCAADHEAAIIEQCAALSIEPLRIILEPFGRNTAPVAAIAARVIGEIDPEGLILLLPADHHIDDPAQFWDCIANGVKAAEDNYLTVLGISPTRPETGFGYIKCGDPLSDNIFVVDRFVEKPSVLRAEAYLASGDYFWNGGIFLFSPSTMITAFESHAPDMLASSDITLHKSALRGSVLPLNGEAFGDVRSESLDYAIMENAKRVAMVAPVKVGWSDIGSWRAIRDMANDRDNMPARAGDVYEVNCSNSYIRAQDGVTVAAVGLDNIIIVATGDSVLVMHADHAQDIKTIVSDLKASGRTDLL